MTRPIDTPQQDGPETAEAVTAAARDWVVRLASRDITAQEMQRFKAWLAAAPGHARAFETERRFWQRLDALKTAAAPQAQPAPATTAAPRHHRHSASPGRPLRRRAALIGAGALAACLALVALTGDLTVMLTADYNTATGAQQRVALPDGSSALLNTDSAIRVDFSEGERRIDLLKGETFFEVAPDRTRPFRVAAEGGTAEAVGTAFIVDAAGAGTTVAVTHGVVAVRSPAGDDTASAPVLVKRGQATRYAEDLPPEAARPATAAELGPWRNGTIQIDDLPLDQALAELDRYRKGRIVLLADSSRLRRVSGAFDIDGIDAAIAALAATQGLTVTEVTDYLVILR